MQVPLDLLHLVSLDAWAALLRAYGAPGMRRAPKSVKQVRAALESASPSIATAVRTLQTLTRDEARPAALEAARALDVDTRSWARGEGTAGLVADLVARAATDTAAAEVTPSRGKARRPSSRRWPTCRAATG